MRWSFKCIDINVSRDRIISNEDPAQTKEEMVETFLNNNQREKHITTPKN